MVLRKNCRMITHNKEPQSMILRILQASTLVDSVGSARRTWIVWLCSRASRRTHSSIGDAANGPDQPDDDTTICTYQRCLIGKKGSSRGRYSITIRRSRREWYSVETWGLPHPMMHFRGSKPARRTTGALKTRIGFWGPFTL